MEPLGSLLQWHTSSSPRIKRCVNNTYPKNSSDLLAVIASLWNSRDDFPHVSLPSMAKLVLFPYCVLDHSKMQAASRRWAADFFKRIITLTHTLIACNMPHLDLLVFIYCSQWSCKKMLLAYLTCNKTKVQRDSLSSCTLRVGGVGCVWGLLDSAPLLRPYTLTPHCSFQRPTWKPEHKHLL